MILTRNNFPRKIRFVKKVIEVFETEDIELLEEKESKKREYLAFIRVNSDLGKLGFLCVAKDKKKISENDFAVALQKAHALKMPVLFLSHGEMDKKAEAYLEIWGNLLMFKKI